MKSTITFFSIPLCLAAAMIPGRADDIYSKDLGAGKVRLIDLSAITSIAVGASTGNEEELEWSQSGSHDPSRAGFNFQALEISLAGAVDPYFTANAYLLVSEEGLELEEAFATTSSLPHGLEIEAGYMLTEFGRYNPTHAHEYAHIDQPLVIGAFMSGEGMRDLGARVGWLLPTDWFSELHLTVQNGDNDTAISFLGEGHDHGDEEEEGGHNHGGNYRSINEIDDLLWSTRWVNGFAIGEDAEIQIGLSAAYGPNRMRDHTTLYGADVVFKWFNPDANGKAGTLTWTTEFIGRDMGAHEEVEEEGTSDYGLVSSLVYQFSPRWQAGLRVDYVEFEEHEEEHHHHDDDDPDEHDHEEEHFPAERFRISPLIAWQPSEFSKLRLQYNYTEDGHGDSVHSLWLGLEVLLGTHPAHNF